MKGNILRKVSYQERVPGKESTSERKYLSTKFIDGCVEKEYPVMAKPRICGRGLSTSLGYGFQQVPRRILLRYFFPMRMALCNYYPVEWMASFLDKEPEKRKEKAINIAKSRTALRFVEADVNTSSFVWEIDPARFDRVLVSTPKRALKGLGRCGY